MLPTNKQKLFRITLTLHLNSLCICFSLANHDNKESFERVWLNHMQVKCINQKITNAAEMLKPYYLCVYLATIQCIRDTYDFTKSSGGVKQQQFDYFCGYIHGFGVSDRQLQ